ncbi:uncharacterized protein LOC117529979 [Thalassophryne amazonica]|uniref:uncharacterized protein LOC117529979 n=1 Tax=Thalassophryne amazonica TaxID=390379 RepID=UPI00147261A2|nr:uncharacterized protein LOC117529979 [Thalassophryne amazonica]
MAADLSQDSVLRFLQSHGGSVKNSDLLVHFRSFLRDHVDRDRHRELFKKFVNNVATVKQEDGVSYVVVRKKFGNFVPAGGGPSGVLAENSTQTLGTNREHQEPIRERSRPAPRREPVGEKVPQVLLQAEPAGEKVRQVLPAAGIIANNTVTSVNEIHGRKATGPVLSHAQIVEKPEPKRPAPNKLPMQDLRTQVVHQQPALSPPPGVSAASHHGETSQQQVSHTHRVREAGLQPEGRRAEPPLLHHSGVHPQVVSHRVRHRQSYKTAVSCDDEEEEMDEEEVPRRPSSAGGVWPLSTPLGQTGSSISVSTPSISEPPVMSSISSNLSERPLPKIYIQGVDEEILPAHGAVQHWNTEVELAGHGAEHTSVLIPRDTRLIQWSLPTEEECSMPTPVQAEEAEPQHHSHNIQLDPENLQLHPFDIQMQGSNQNQREWLSPSHSIVSLSSNASCSSNDRVPSGSPRGSAWNSSSEDLHTTEGDLGGGVDVHRIRQRAQASKVESVTLRGGQKMTPPWHHSTGHLHDDQDISSPGLLWHRSTGDLYDDSEEAEMSEDSTSSPPCSAVPRRLKSKLRSRMCRSLGADLDQLLPGNIRGRGCEAARLDRIHRISSSLSLCNNLSSSSLSSCSTPPHCHSFADMVAVEEQRGGRRSHSVSSSARHDGSDVTRQSTVPLEPREHVWLVKSAAGAWTDIYSLFREDSSLLNKRDFISGFTVLHWIAKHGDHRVLNTLWYGVDKAGLAFDVNARSTCGHTPLHIAAIHGHKNIIRLLVHKFNADIHLRDTSGKKPWQYLSSSTSTEVFQLLEAPPPTNRGGHKRGDLSSEQQRRHHLIRHHLSSASSGQRLLTIGGTTRVKRSSSLAAFLKHKSLHRFHANHPDTSV